MHVLVIVERVEKIHDLLVRGTVHFAKFLGDVAHLRGDDIPARRLQRLGNVVEVFDLGRRKTVADELAGLEAESTVEEELKALKERLGNSIGPQAVR